ncbi:zinc finger protein 721 isoform X2 [Scleropages formosus]|uniref:Zinc finger protein 729-like n=1 Tax=Scleropages formosus TaxID=113540 RepID=A0A8C9TMH8_SCLFO|nr:zinc finger protein 721-like isoform X2 [Scleropages formosus]
MLREIRVVLDASKNRTTMAAVYTVNESSVQGDNGGLSCENVPRGSKLVISPLVVKPKKIKAEYSTTTSAEEAHGGCTDPEQVSRHHATGDDALVEIKEERNDDEEYFQIKLGDIGGNSDERVQNNESDQEEQDKESAADVKLRIMRCQDCGERFTHLKAFQIHLLQHGVDKEGTFLNQGWKKSNKARPVHTKRAKEAQRTDADANRKTLISSSSEDLTVCSQVAMLPKKQKSVYTSNKVYACAVCGKVYSYLESFRNHQKLHQNKEEKPDAFSCLECGKIFYNASSFMSHIKMHKTVGGSYKFRCDQCNKNFNSYQTWMAHREIHRRKPFWCLSCARGFRDAEGLDRHLLGHDLKRHKCDICSKTFRVPAELRYHYNTHTGAKPYTCGLCRKKFSQLGNLITHRKKHVGVYKEGSETPLGSRNKQFAGKRRVTVMKKLVVMAMGEVQEAKGADLNIAEEKLAKQGSETEEMASGREDEGDERPKDAKEQEDLECFECGTLFRLESDLHQHYMKHASGEL